jgi:hypothetical protein
VPEFEAATLAFAADIDEAAFEDTVTVDNVEAELVKFFAFAIAAIAATTAVWLVKKTSMIWVMLMAVNGLIVVEVDSAFTVDVREVNEAIRETVEFATATLATVVFTMAARVVELKVVEDTTNCTAATTELIVALDVELTVVLDVDITLLVVVVFDVETTLFTAAAAAV